AEMAQDAEARMAVFIAIGLDDAPVVVAAHGVGLEAWHDSYIQYACAIVKADRNRLWWGSNRSKYGILGHWRRSGKIRAPVMIRIYKCRCACRAIEILAREDSRL